LLHEHAAQIEKAVSEYLSVYLGTALNINSMKLFL